MTFPEIKLVDAPTASATVMFDFNDVTASPKREVTADDFTIGVPDVEGDVDAIDPLYSDRMVSFVCAMTGTKPQVAAAQSALARRLLAPGQGWLMVRLTATSRLLFFRTYRPQPGDLSFELVQSSSATKVERWELQVNLPCEPFAYGERVNQAVQTLSNNPGGAAGTNPCRITLPAITGDAPTRLRLTTSGSAVDQSGYRYMISLLSSPTAQTPVLMDIGTGDTFAVAPVGGTDTGDGVTDAAYSAGSYRATTFATNTTHSRRLVAAATPPLLPGRYRILVRIGRNITGAGVQFSMSAKLGTVSTPAVITNPTPAGGSGYGATWVDLGVVSFPTRADPNSTSATTGPLTLLAGRTAGTGELRWDAVLFVPVTNSGETASQTLYATFSGNPSSDAPGGGTGGATNTFDGDAELFWSSNGAAFCELSGTFPVARPGNAHVLAMLTHVTPIFDGVVRSDVTTTSIQVAVSYMPRFLYVGDS